MNLPVDGRWIIGCSGGSDSMALLHMCQKSHLDMVVITVNYHQRDTADRDVKVVVDYCSKYQIPVDVVDVHIKEKSNFQLKAREERYRAFSQAVKKYEAKGVLVAHHKDDVLETYLWQKKRGHRVKTYGMSAESEIYGVKVYRPLLEMTKKDLLDYIDRNQIVYGEDESNEQQKYMRNRIRKQLKEMSEETKQTLLDNMLLENKELALHQKEVSKVVEDMKDEFDVQLLYSFSSKLQVMILQEWLSLQGYMYTTSQKELLEWLRQLKSEENRWIVLKEGYILVSNYHKVKLVEQFSYEYCFIFDRIEFVHTPYFRIETSGTVREGLTLYDDDWPIMIRNWQPSDTIHLSFGRKKVSRWFIDHKIAKDQRLICPVVLNQKNQVIFVAGIGSDINHFSNTPSLFVLK